MTKIIDEKALAVKWALERIGDGTGSLVEDVRYSGDEPHSVELQNRKVELSQALITARQHMKISVERVAKAKMACTAAIPVATTFFFLPPYDEWPSDVKPMGFSA